MASRKTLFCLVISIMINILASEETKVFYAKDWNAAKIDSTIRADKGNWTVFLDADKPWGLGEFEDVWRERMHFMGDCRALWCLHPVGIEIGLSDDVYKYRPDASLEVAWKCSNFDKDITPTGGFRCFNKNQFPSAFKSRDPACEQELCDKNGMWKKCKRCFNAKVRYFCLKDDYQCQFGVFPNEING